MGKSKLRRFKENSEFNHVIEPAIEDVLNVNHPLKGNWNSDFFIKPQPITLELGCGKGEYTIGLCKTYPEKNFLGIDIKGARLWRGAKTIEEEDIENAGFLRTRIEFIESFFDKEEVSEIWVTFPDPQLKERRAKKRLTSSRFLTMYRKFLAPGGIVHLKTDSKELYDYTYSLLLFNEFEIIQATPDLYHDLEEDPILAIKTHYEQIFTKEGKKITYLKFRLNHNNPIKEPPIEE